MDSVGVHGRGEAVYNTLMESPEALSAWQAIPHLIDGPLTGLLENTIDLFDRGPLPLWRVVDLLQPLEHLGLFADLRRNGSCRLHGTSHRGNPDLVHMIEACQALCDPSCLLLSQFGERRVIAGDAIRCPVGLPMADEEDVHPPEDKA